MGTDYNLSLCSKPDKLLPNQFLKSIGIKTMPLHAVDYIKEHKEDLAIEKYLTNSTKLIEDEYGKCHISIFDECRFQRQYDNTELCSEACRIYNKLTQPSNCYDKYDFKSETLLELSRSDFTEFMWKYSGLPVELSTDNNGTVILMDKECMEQLISQLGAEHLIEYYSYFSKLIHEIDWDKYTVCYEVS